MQTQHATTTHHQPQHPRAFNLARLPAAIKPAVWEAIQRDKPALADLLSDPVARELNAVFQGTGWTVDRDQLPESALAIIEGRS